MLKPEFVQELLNSNRVKMVKVTGEITCCFCGQTDHVGRQFTTDNVKLTLCDDCGEEMEDVAHRNIPT